MEFRVARWEYYVLERNGGSILARFCALLRHQHTSFLAVTAQCRSPTEAPATCQTTVGLARQVFPADVVVEVALALEEAAAQVTSEHRRVASIACGGTLVVHVVIRVARSDMVVCVVNDLADTRRTSLGLSRRPCSLR